MSKSKHMSGREGTAGALAHGVLRNFGQWCSSFIHSGPLVSGVLRLYHSNNFFLNFSLRITVTGMFLFLVYRVF